MRPLCGLLLCCVLSCVVAAPARSEDRLVRVCDSDLDYPPFGWVQRNAAGKIELHGYTRKLLTLILSRHGWRYRYDLLPFNRCLRDVREGTAHQLVLNASSNPERERQYFVSDPFAYAHFHAFYRRSRFPDGAPVHNKPDLRRYQICGMAGHNFSMFEIPAEKLDMGADSYSTVFQKLKLGRCDIFPYNMEVLSGYRLLGQDYLSDPDIAHVALEDVPHWPFRMLISRQWPQGAELTSMINAELAVLRKSGELQKLMDEVMALPVPR